MKKLFILGLTLITFVASSACFADSGKKGTPNLVGTWTVKAEGGVILRGTQPGSITHHSGEFSSLVAEAVITKQQGRILHGTFKSAKATENFVAAISMDNDKIFFADQDGFYQGEIEDNDTIEIVYRHVTPNDIVAAVGVWTRKK